MTSWQNDEAIRKSADDKLGYSPYASKLTERILNSPTPLTVGIFGPWGSGKTSLMRLIEANCDEAGSRVPPTKGLLTMLRAVLRWKREKTAINQTVWVDVWRLSGREEVWDAFLQALVNEVHRLLPIRKKLNWIALGRQLAANTYRIVLALVPVVATVVLIKGGSAANTSSAILTKFFADHKLALGTGSITLDALLLFWAFREPLKSAVSFDVKALLRTGSYQERITQLAKMSKQFEGFVKELVGEGRLIIFIDDLDRCPAKAIPEVLEAIRLFAAEKRCIYVLGLDQRAVLGAIQETHKLTEPEASRYFEKLVQIPFQIPPLSAATIQEFLKPLVASDVAGVFAHGLEPTPRALKRSFQIYSIWDDLHKFLLVQWQVDPLEPELIAKWLTIQMRYRPLSDFVVRHTEHLLWLERDALRRAAGTSCLDARDARLLQDADADKPYAEAPTLTEYERKELDALLTSGKCRFNQRVYRETLESYIYLGGTSGGPGGRVRARSRERRMLLSFDPAERQKVINQLLNWGGIGPYRDRDIAQVYPERLRDSSVLLEPLEKAQVDAARSAFQPTNDETVYVPARLHVFGAPEEWIEQAQQQDPNNFNEKLAERERVRPPINIPGFRIGRFPVRNSEYGLFIDATRSDSFKEPVPFSIVEYVAYVEPEAAGRWDFRPEGGVSKRIEFGENNCLSSVRLDLLTSGTGRSLAITLDKDSAELPLLYRRCAVLRQTGHIALVTIGDGLNIENIGQRVFPSDFFSVLIRVWKDDRTILLQRAPQKATNSKHDHPVTGITWEDAVAYCVWWRRETNTPYRLPREPEWEAAATSDGLQQKTPYPWGEKWNSRWTNTKESKLDCTTPVGLYSPEGDSPFAVADMVGNVWEWCADPLCEVRDTTESGLLWEDIRLPFRGGGRRPFETLTRVARGGSFRDSKAFARTTCRMSFEPTKHTSASLGFRVAVASELEGLKFERK